MSNNKQLPKGWEIKKLGEVCKFVRGPFGGSLKKSIFKESGYAVYEQKHAIYDRFDNVRYFVDEEKFNEMKRFELNSGDLIMSCSGTIGKIAIVPDGIEKGIINQALLILSPKNNLNNIFLKLWMQSENFQDSLNEYSKGAAIKNIASVKVLKNIDIPLPSIEEQKRIVSILDRAFEAIDKAKANAEQNLKNAKELFQSKLQAIFDNGKLKIENGEWEEKKLGEVIQKTETINPKLNPEKEFIYIDVSSVNKETKLIDETSILRGQDAPSRARKVVKTNDVIFATVRPTHQRVAIISDRFNNQVCSTGYYVLRAKEIIHHKIIYYYILTFRFNKEMEKLQKGASYPAVTNKEVETSIIPFPKSIETQKQIVAQLDKLQAETKKLEAIYQQKIEDLEELKKSIMQKAFNGELSEKEMSV